MRSFTHVFFVGIKGVAMANLALLLKQMGIKVSGSDIAEHFITQELLSKNAIEVSSGFAEQDVPLDTDLVVYSSAHRGGENPQVQEAKKRGIGVVSQAQLLGKLMSSYPESIAVCGSHGKTTCSSFLSYALVNLHANPSYMVGTSRFNTLWGGNYSEGQYFVAEADEYGVNMPLDKTPKFLFLHPKMILCTNIDYDHPDVYEDLSEVKRAFSRFFNEAQLFLCADDKPLMEVAEHLQSKSLLTYGFSPKANFRIIENSSNESCSTFKLARDGKEIGSFTVSLFGDKNITNAAGVISILLSLGFDFQKIDQAIKNFSGAKRRFEKIAEKNQTVLMDDYAHHPHEIDATIDAARKQYPYRKLILIFQPHTFSRSSALKQEFAQSLSKADLALLLPIFPSSRENPENFTISSHDIAKLSTPGRVFAADSKSELLTLLQPHLQGKTVVFTMGAGDVYQLKNDIINIL